MTNKTSITVSQHFNRCYKQGMPTDGIIPEYLYKVEKTVNTMIVKIGEEIPPQLLQDLINANHNVTIVPVK